MSNIALTKLTGARWWALYRLAMEVMIHAYVPYSRFKVGAATLVNDGRLVSGYNAENAGYGVTLCVECGLVSELTHTGGRHLVAFACVDTHDQALAPCGRRCQLLSKYAIGGMVLVVPSGMMGIDGVLPGRFCVDDVERVVDPQS